MSNIIIFNFLIENDKRQLQNLHNDQIINTDKYLKEKKTLADVKYLFLIIAVPDAYRKVSYI